MHTLRSSYLQALRAGARTNGLHQSNGVKPTSGLFRLRGNSRRAPGAAWIRRERLDTLPAGELEGILPMAPDCVIELRSPSDRIEDLLSKMREYIESGVALAWLIDPVERRCYEFRPGQSPITRLDPAEMSGDPELPGFVLDLRPVW